MLWVLVIFINSQIFPRTLTADWSSLIVAAVWSEPFFQTHIKVVFILTIYDIIPVSLGLAKGVKEDVERNIIYGPKRYVPQPNEWIHQFKWHGTDSKDKARKVPGATNFQ